MFITIDYIFTWAGVVGAPFLIIYFLSKTRTGEALLPIYITHSQTYEQGEETCDIERCTFEI